MPETELETHTNIGTKDNNIMKRPENSHAVFYSVIWPKLQQEGWTMMVGGDGISDKETMFAPSGVAIENAVKGKDCFTLSGTIERLLERRNTTESSLADSYLAHIGSADKQHQDQLLRGNNGEEGQENNRIISHLKESKEPSRLEAAREGDRGDSPAGRGGNSDKANGSSSPHPGKPNAVQTSPSHGPDALKEPITITNGNEDEGDENEDEDEGSEDDSDDDKDALSGQHEGASRSSRKNFRIKISMGPSKDKNGKGQRSAADDNDKNGDNLASAVRGKSDSEDELKDISEPLSNNNSDEESAYESVEETKSKKRKRGRPQREETVVKRKRGRPKRKRGTSPQPSPSGKKTREQANEAIDLSWKDGGKNFPKRISRVGAKYNATFIEAAGTWKENESTIYMEQVWDPKKAEEMNATNFLEKRNIPHNKREAAMVALHEIGYDTAKFDEEKIIDKIKSGEGTNWTEEERKKFHSEFFRVRKEFREVAKATGKSVNACLAYYLATFKNSDDYRLLKTVCYEERFFRLLESEHDVDACSICGDGGNLLICDGCEGEYHMGCMRPALKVVPEGKWECDECVDRAFVEAKDYIIRNSRLYERVDNYGKKVSSAEGHTSRGGASGHKVAEENGSEGNRSSDKQANSTASPGVRLRATSPVMRIATKLAETISSAFSEDPKKANGNGVGTKERFLLTGAASQGGDTMDVDDEYR